MTARRREPASPPPACGLTVFGGEPDELALFETLAPARGVAVTIAGGPAEATVRSLPRNRYVSVDHRTEVSSRTLGMLARAGVEHLTTRSIGLDHVDLAAAAAHGIMVENVAYAPDGVADFTVMLILMALRHASSVLRSATGHDFRLPAVRGRDLRDLTVGVVGVGSIGGAVVERLQGFGCRVLAHREPARTGPGAEFVGLPQLLRRSDVVTLHVPLDASTHRLLGPREIGSMKRGAVLVNTGRGALVDTEALLTALESGHLGGAALDVVDGEAGIFYTDRRAHPFEHAALTRLLQRPDVIVTPHTAFHTARALHETVEQTLRKCRDFERSRTRVPTQDRVPLRRPVGGT